MCFGQWVKARVQQRHIMGLWNKSWNATLCSDCQNMNSFHMQESAGISFKLSIDMQYWSKYEYLTRLTRLSMIDWENRSSWLDNNRTNVFLTILSILFFCVSADKENIKGRGSRKKCSWEQKQEANNNTCSNKPFMFFADRHVLYQSVKKTTFYRFH